MKRFLWHWAWVLALTVPALGCGPAGEASVPGPPSHVIVVILDALRADHLGCYGYGRNTAPFVGKLAGEGVVFEQALSNSSYTCESVSSLFMGQNPSRNSWGAGWYARPDPGVMGLAAHFQKAGFATGLFATTPMLDHAPFFVGFDEAECLGLGYDLSGQAPRLRKQALAFLKKHGGKRTFQYLHYLDPHSPYDPPDEEYGRFGGERCAAPLRLYQDVRPNLPALVAEGFGPGEARFEDLVTRYDGEIAFVDKDLRLLVAGLKELGILDETLIVFTSDHGEEFLDHGWIEHAWYLYREVLHVPLIFWAPGRLEAGRVEGWVSLVDVMPTLLALCGIDSAREDLDGTPIFRKEGERWRPKPSGKPVISELLVQMRSVARSVVLRNMHYIAAQKWVPPEERSRIAPHLKQLRDDYASGKLPLTALWGPVVHEELYSLTDDPKEEKDLMGEGADVVEEMQRVLKAFGDSCPAPLPHAYKARQATEDLSEEQLRQLKALGYLGDGHETEGAQGDAEDAAREEVLKSIGYL